MRANPMTTEKKPELQRKACKGRLYPSNQSAFQLLRQIELTQEVYNAMLGFHQWTRACGFKLRKNTYQLHRIFKQGKAQFPHWQELDSRAVCSAIKFLEKSIEMEGEPDRKGGKFGAPTPRVQKWKKSYTTTQFSIFGKRIKLNKIDLPIRMDRPIPAGWTPKQATISLDCGRWYVSISMIAEKETYPPLRTEGKEIGIDLGAGSGNLVVTSDNRRFESPKSLITARRHLRRCQQNVSRAQEGSNRHRRKRMRLQRAHKRVANIREANHHLVSRRLISGDEPKGIAPAKAIGVETLRRLKADDSLPKRIQRKKNRTLKNAALHKLLWFLEYKAKQAGTEIVSAPRWYPSTKTCAKCGREKTKKLDTNIRIFKCANPKCGNEMDRDDNAALNLRPRILRELLAEEKRKTKRVKRISRRATVESSGTPTASNGAAGHHISVVGREKASTNSSGLGNNQGSASPGAPTQPNGNQAVSQDCEDKYSNFGKARGQVMTESHEALESQMRSNAKAESKPLRDTHTMATPSNEGADKRKHETAGGKTIPQSPGLFPFLVLTAFGVFCLFFYRYADFMKVAENNAPVDL